ncbi:alpha-1,3-mannosyltransferase MNT2 SKDI_07G0090 [Saccharomyces kudriavzevii IFO 1802]|uniref:MNT4-like protein n=1 Tax=Saccharomyces kudriavzevii (strain ATCC MYA-4449 / AS 2.2408 / CBS 8840 / NBRC 1802 / NCYC 2889) TaxID=226230 RepID=A0AA35JIX8_SACK1|nr:uncharacterized protein SKDI_07G0090 [Saccharomyces kudriavzevii IFO 1802]CAI4061285.1 hypothetical protein SKDI_07G0090 [Saccharomyces kudriavzevii IFO 1802]
MQYCLLGKKRKNRLFTLIMLLTVLLMVYYSVDLSVPVQHSSSDRSNSCDRCLSYYETLEPGWSNDFYDVNQKSLAPAEDVIKLVTRIIIFSKCLQQGGRRNVQRLRNVEKRLFPYINFERLETDETNFWHSHTRWNGEVHHASVMEFDRKGHHFVRSRPINFDTGLSFWENWLQRITQSGSRGIVISASDTQLDETVRLLKVLRYFKNDYPIQIVHNADLSQDSIRLLVKYGRSEDTPEYPAQEIWFSNVRNLLSPKYSNKFATYSNKWLALIFSFFEVPILLDSDTVPFVPIDEFYKLEEFQRTGALFFKDRIISNDLFESSQLDVLKEIIHGCIGLNLTDESDIHEKIEDPTVVQVLENMLIKKHKHHLESGLVVLHKDKHLFSVLISVALQFSPISEYFHGDKDWFWMGELLSNNHFTFHPVDASNIGQFGNVVSKESTGEFYQICSVQLSHTDKDGSLLWLNGGLNVCKKASWEYDYEHSQRLADMFQDAEALRKYYQSPVKLEGIIIPDANISGWVKSGECFMFNYCTLFKEAQFGKAIKFKESEKRRFSEIVRIWNENVF